MAVHTKLSKIDIRSLLLNYKIGNYLNHSEIVEGIENSNFFIQTDISKYVLTIFEKRVKSYDLPFFLQLMCHTQKKGVDCPVPITNRKGSQFGIIKDKKFAIFNFLYGKSLKTWNNDNCFEVGKKISDFHFVNKEFKLKRNNNFGINQFLTIYNKIENKVEEVLPGSKSFIIKEIYFLKENYPKKLPKGIIHADLFPDNVLFIKKKISGIIDFYFSSLDYLIYDLSIAINAWCFPNNSFNKGFFNNLIKGFQYKKKITNIEYSYLNICLRTAAMRFLLTRLFDTIYPSSDIVKKKSPQEFFDILNFHQLNDITKAR